VVAEARERVWELFEREQVPQEVRQTLSGSLAGDLRKQQLLFQAMVDTWPRLQKALGEVKRAARKAPWRVNAWCARGESPGAEAEAVAKTVEHAMWGMRPDPVRGLKGFEGMVEELAAGYFLGHQVMELHWARDGAGWRPEAAKVVPPRYYGYPYDVEGGDRLMLDPAGGAEGFQAYEDFPRHRFLVAVNGGHSGHAAVSAPLRALTGYWLAAVYGLKWLMGHAQVFGQPVRWAEYVAGDARAKAEIQQMMQRIGTEAWGIFPAGTKLNFVETGKSAASLPQRELLALADEQCDVFILGQNLTSSSGNKGTQALGTVHREVRQELMEGVCDFVGEILTHQFAPAVVALNYGECRTLVPEVRAVFEKPKDEKAMAERDVVLGLGTTLPVGKAWFYERHGIPLPVEGEVVLEGGSGK
jgi:phage gp29-like protein